MLLDGLYIRNGPSCGPSSGWGNDGIIVVGNRSTSCVGCLATKAVALIYIVQNQPTTELGILYQLLLIRAIAGGNWGIGGQLNLNCCSFGSQ